jgi:HSP20 family molecular chaperone IbpA
MIEQTVKASSNGYPPYNIEQLSDQHFRISLAVAGFLVEELAVEVAANELKITGKQTEEADRSFIHRGIAARQFQRLFVLASGLEVTGSWLDDGILHIDIKRPASELRTRRIEIKKGR